MNIWLFLLELSTVFLFCSLLLLPSLIRQWRYMATLMLMKNSVAFTVPLASQRQWQQER